MPDEMIRAVTHPQGDWVEVRIAREHETGDHWFIDRVVLWALRPGDKVAGSRRGGRFDGRAGHDRPLPRPLLRPRHRRLPDGRPWNEVYHSVRPSPVMVREITEQGRKW